MTPSELRSILTTGADGKTRDLRYRQRQFISLHNWITRNAEEIEAAAQKDDKLSKQEAQLFVASLLADLRSKYDSLDLKKEVATEYSVKDSQDNPARRIPHGIVYVIPEKYTLFLSVVCVLCTCLSAGSCCLVELPMDLRHSSSILRRCFAEALDKQAFAVVNSRPTDEILRHCYMIDQVGSTSAHVTTTLLSEPAARTAVMVDRTANLELAAKEIIAAKSFGASQSPYAPNCILVNEFVEAEFTRLLLKHLPGTASSHMNGSAYTSNLNDGITQPKAAKHAETSNVVITTSSYKIIKVAQRTEINTSTEKDSHSLPMLAVSSYDDAIDTLNTKKEKQLLAFYVFADPLPAKYLTQFVRTRVSFVNHIPANLLVGPAAPIAYSVSTVARYSREMLEIPSPQYVHPSKGAFSASELDRAFSKEANNFYQASLQPLKPMGQPREGEMNFFLQGLVASFVCYVAPVVLGTIAVGAYGSFKLYGHFF